MFALHKGTDQLFRTAVLLSPYSRIEHIHITEFGSSRLDAAAERCARHVEMYVAHQGEEPGDEPTTAHYALEEIAGLAIELWQELEEILKTWCDFCDLAHERNRGSTISTASMVALESPEVRSFAENIGLPVGDTAGRLSRLHGLVCPMYQHKYVPRLILDALPNLGYFL